MLLPICLRAVHFEGRTQPFYLRPLGVAWAATAVLLPEIVRSSGRMSLFSIEGSTAAR